MSEEIKATVPSSPVRYRFQALTTFESPETRSVYCEGEMYSVREGNEKLHALVQDWVSEEKVRIA